MSAVKITKQTVHGALPRAVRYTIFDSAVSGFGLKVFPSGEQRWIFEYRPGAGGRSASKKRVTIGRASDLTPDMARREADKLRAVVKTGGDPQGAKAAQRSAPTVTDVAKAFREQHLKKRAPKTKKYYEDLLDRLILPRLGTKKAKDVTASEVASLHRSFEDTPYQGNRVLAVISSLYTFASGPAAPAEIKVPDGLNPARRVERFDEVERGRVLSNDELERLGAALRLAETEGIPWSINPNGKVKHVPKEAQRTVTSPFAVAAIRLLIFTGARLREILNLRWQDVDFDRGLLLIRKHKTARTAGVKSIVLNLPALDVLQHIPKIGAYVIAGDTAGEPDERPRTDIKRPWSMVRKQAGLDDLRAHDLRHNFGGFGAGGGAGLYIVGKLLGHSPKNPKTTARYSHLADDPLRRASNSIGAAIAAAMSERPAPNDPTEGDA